MSKQSKGNREAKKPKVVSKETRKQKKALKRQDGLIGKLLSDSK